MREIVLDTETTGLDARDGDRLIEIGCVELNNLIPTGRVWHSYLNPQRPVSAGALEVHGLSDAFLADKPFFAQIVEAFESFIAADRLVIHNAAFDMQFINAELARVGRSAIVGDRVVDTLAIARRRHPAGPNTLDALCQRYGVDNSRRTRHGALLDAEILAEVYVELMGGRQAALGLADPASGRSQGRNAAALRVAREAAFVRTASPDEEAAHQSLVADLGEKALWRRYLGEG